MVSILRGRHQHLDYWGNAVDHRGSTAHSHYNLIIELNSIVLSIV